MKQTSFQLLFILRLLVSARSSNAIGMIGGLLGALIVLGLRRSSQKSSS